MNSTLSLFLVLVVATASTNAALTINYENDIGGDTLLRDANGSPLTTGPKGAGDGAVIQLGYYSLATSENPFAGAWTPLAGAGTTVSASTIGDGIGGGVLNDGLLSGSVVISTSQPGLVANMPIVIRFYDATTLGGSTHYNAVTIGSDWGWINPTSGNNTLNLKIFPSSANAMTWEGGSGSAYRTTLTVVPEASASMLLLLGSLGITARRKRN